MKVENTYQSFIVIVTACRADIFQLFIFVEIKSALAFACKQM
jgi:hypothetical protein